MDHFRRLQLHLKEAKMHIERLKSAQKRLHRFYPLDCKKIAALSPEDLDKLDVLAFRFAKLQDLLGSKIFREYLWVVRFPTEGKDFLTLLKELEKEEIVDIDLWSEFRAVRNSLAHDYPYDDEEKIEAINYLIEKIDDLIDITKKIEVRLEAITQRD